MRKVVTAGTRPLAKFRNIRVTKDGYQVVVVRERVEQTKFFARHTKESLRNAELYRDQLLKKLPSKRLNPVPKKVLASLGLTEPVVGVFRHPKKECYAVSFVNEAGRSCTQAFSFRTTADEVAAYEEAVKFRQKALRASAKALKSLRA